MISNLLLECQRWDRYKPVNTLLSMERPSPAGLSLPGKGQGTKLLKAHQDLRILLLGRSAATQIHLVLVAEFHSPASSGAGDPTLPQLRNPEQPQQAGETLLEPRANPTSWGSPTLTQHLKAGNFNSCLFSYGREKVFSPVWEEAPGEAHQPGTGATGGAHREELQAGRPICSHSLAMGSSKSCLTKPSTSH